MIVCFNPTTSQYLKEKFSDKSFNVFIALCYTSLVSKRDQRKGYSPRKVETITARKKYLLIFQRADYYSFRNKLFHSKCVNVSVIS